MEDLTINTSKFKMWGMAGGELEFVSARIGWRETENGRYERVIILRFTDHDVTASPHAELIDEKYYETICPLADIP